MALFRELNKLGQDGSSDIGRELSAQSRNERNKLLEELQEEISSDENMRREIEDQIAELERRKRQLDALKDEYDLAIGV